jgi:type II secretion system protein G
MRKAFTLIEILIVVILLAILAAIVIPMFSDATDQARQAKIDTDISSLESQIELYRAQTGGYPSALSDLESSVLAGVDVNGDGVVNASDTYGPWIKDEPLRPNGANYTYTAATGTVTAP